jgi:hypothetical protein
MRGKTFYRFDLAPGEHVLSSVIPGGRATDLKITAGVGKQVYIRDRLKMGIAAVTNVLETVASDEGASALRNCQLLERA